MRRAHVIDAETFRIWLATGAIRAAYLEDCYGTHHCRPLYLHPRTGQKYVAVAGSEAEKYQPKKG